MIWLSLCFQFPNSNPSLPPDCLTQESPPSLCAFQELSICKVSPRPWRLPQEPCSIHISDKCPKNQSPCPAVLFETSMTLARGVLALSLHHVVPFPPPTTVASQPHWEYLHQRHRQTLQSMVSAPKPPAIEHLPAEHYSPLFSFTQGILTCLQHTFSSKHLSFQNRSIVHCFIKILSIITVSVPTKGSQRGAQTIP